MADPQVEPAKKLKRTAIKTSSSPQKPKVLKHKQGSVVENQALEESEDSDDNANQLQAPLTFEENSNTSFDSDSQPEDILNVLLTDEDSCEMEVEESSPDPIQRRLAENFLPRTIEITGKINVDCVLIPICALLNSGGGVLVITIADYSKCENPFKKLDVFWQKLETRLESMIQPSSCNEVFDRVIKQDRIILFIKAPNHWCTMKYNLILPGESKKLVPSFRNTVELLLNKPVGKKKKFSYCKVRLEKLPPLPERYLYEQKLDFHESKNIQLKHFESDNGILHNNNRTQHDKIVEQISAFANGSGGIILIGVKDDGTVLGQNLDSEGNRKEDVKERVELIVQGMKWSCTPESNLHWKVDFIPVGQDKECCYVIAISVAGMKGGVFTKSPKSYELRPGDDGEETIHLLEFKEWKQRILCGTNMLQNESKAMREVNKKFNALSISDRVLLTVKGSVGKIRESFFTVGKGCPISPKGFESNLPEAAQLVIRRLQEMSSRGRNRALLVASRSLNSSINGKSLSVDGVICDLLLFNAELGGLHLFTLCDSETDEQFLSYSHATAKALKKALVTIGGCHEQFYIVHHVVPCRAPAPTEQIGQLFPDSRYPQEYDLEKPRDKINKILESLVIILATVTVPSPLSNKQGISFLNLLTKEQFQLVYQEIDYHRELWIKGVAGSGKTLVAVEFVKELRRRHPNLKQDEILYVCENKGIRQQISNHGICQCVCRATFMLRKDWSEVKHIVMDEVQSYRDGDRERDGDNWLQKAKKVVRQHSIENPGYLWLFIDKNQINHCHPTAIPLEREQVPDFRLRRVIRNSKRIVEFASKICLDKNAAKDIEMGHDLKEKK
ncbi:platelet maturation [Desmophyllum pertusum]|uniref:Platelet maturation n=1 Tax=Desmophyllum pertusum TaxID=174260 RepID=A0A9X0CM29_9CNID|nr:platelet maturation [Desmophyllum pertusum]